MEIRPEIYDGDSVRMAIIMASVFMVIIAGLIMMWAEYSGLLRYTLLLTFTTLVLMVPAYLLFQESARSYIPEPERHDIVMRGDLEEIRGLMKRAFRGYMASQAMLEDRLREDMIRRISVRKRIPMEAVRESSRDRKKALLMTGDDDLARLLSERKSMSRSRRAIFIRPSQEYRAWIMRVVKKMEEWK